MQKTEDSATQTPQQIGVISCAPEGHTSDIHCATLAKYSATSHKRGRQDICFYRSFLQKGTLNFICTIACDNTVVLIALKTLNDDEAK